MIVQVSYNLWVNGVVTVFVYCILVLWFNLVVLLAKTRFANYRRSSLLSKFPNQGKVYSNFDWILFCASHLEGNYFLQNFSFIFLFLGMCVGMYKYYNTCLKNIQIWCIICIVCNWWIMKCIHPQTYVAICIFWVLERHHNVWHIFTLNSWKEENSILKIP